MARTAITRRAKVDSVKANFNGSSCAYLPAAQAGDFDFTTSFTLETDFFMNSLTNFYLISKYSFTGNQRQYSLNTSSGLFYLNVSGDGTSGALPFMQFRLDRALEIKKHYHIAVNFDTATDNALFYVNGNLQLSSVTNGGDVTAPMLAGTAAFVLAGQENAGVLQNKFSGKMWNTRIWKDRVRTAEEIKNNRFALDSDRTGLVGHYFVDEANLEDQSGNGNNLLEDGTITFDFYGRAVSDRTASAADRVAI